MGAPSLHSTTGRRSRRSRSGIRVGSLLVLAAILPLIGISIGIGNSVGRVDDATSAARETQRLVDNTLLTAEVERVMRDEVWWATIERIAAAVTTDTAMVETMFGFDLEAEGVASREASDAILARADDPDLDELVAAFRSAGPALADATVEYDLIDDHLRDEIAQSIAALRRAPDVAGLEDAIDAHESALVLRRSIRAEVFGLFAVDFALRDDPPAELARMIDARSDVRIAVARLAELGRATPRPPAMRLRASP